MYKCVMPKKQTNKKKNIGYTSYLHIHTSALMNMNMHAKKN